MVTGLLCIPTTPVAQPFGHSSIAHGLLPRDEPWVKSILELGDTWSPRSNPCNEMDSRGYTPLLYAAHEGHDKVVGLLLQWGADAHIKDGRFDMTAPTIAAERGHVATLRVLLDHGTSPNTSHGQEEGTLLHYAV
jgi:hypothetical protein